jgi:signal transduction histidine kinase/predicted RNA-binding protein with TRAM domain
MSPIFSVIRKYLSLIWNRTEFLLPWVVLVIILSYSFAYFLVNPYTGFSFNPVSGNVEKLYVDNQSPGTLKVGDEITEIGSVKLSTFQADGHTVFFKGVKSGQVVDIQVKRNGQPVMVTWVMPGFNDNEFRARFFNLWILAYVFWAFGIITQSFIRPKDVRWKLLISINYLTGIWIILGNLSAKQIWHSSLLLHALSWLVLPVYINLHWIFPRPLKRLNPYFWASFYILCAISSLLQYLQVFPRSLYLVALILMILGSLGLLITHFIYQPDRRSEVGFLVLAAFIALVPLLILGVLRMIGIVSFSGTIALLALPILPAAYIYIIYRRQLGGLEVRANVVISIFIYSALLIALYIPITFLITSLIKDPSLEINLNLVSTLLLCIISVLLFPRFRRWVEYHILKMPLPPIHILELYTARIMRSIDTNQLKQVICDKILPSLLIRQAAIIRLDARLSPRQVCLKGVDETQLPNSFGIRSLLEEADEVRQQVVNMEKTLVCPWAKVILPIHQEGKVFGICLLGRRDPDDYYASTEIPIFQALMDLTALALLHIDQSERLLALYRSDIEWQEENRHRLALELHDDVLGEMAILMMSHDGSENSPQFTQAYQKTTDHIRHIITGLRPSMLNYGLHLAIKELAEDASENGDQTKIHLEINPDQIRFSPTMELHIFRIVQQACRNVLEHAHARNIWIRGNLDEKHIELNVEDDGRGFETDGSVDIPELLAKKHFGLVGMYERAALIGANITIESSPDHGTRIRVVWSQPAQENS